jgi:hypothetical protein
MQKFVEGLCAIAFQYGILMNCLVVDSVESHVFIVILTVRVMETYLDRRGGTGIILMVLVVSRSGILDSRGGGGY